MATAAPEAGPCPHDHPPTERVRYASGKLACRACLRIYNNAWNAANPEATRDRLRRRRDKIVAVVREGKQKPCADCAGVFHFAAMEYDHRPGEHKRFDLARAAQLGRSISAVRAEMAKCDVVCASCHRVRSYARGQHFTTEREGTK